MAQCQRERLLLDTTIWMVIAGFIPVLDHSLQGLRAGGRESLESTVAAWWWPESFIYSYLAVFSVSNTIFAKFLRPNNFANRCQGEAEIFVKAALIHCITLQHGFCVARRIFDGRWILSIIHCHVFIVRVFRGYLAVFSKCLTGAACFFQEGTDPVICRHTSWLRMRVTAIFAHVRSLVLLF